MDNANIFMRGQVWYWEDPTYGKKEYGRKVTIGEGGLRHDRYVLISQSEDTINHDTVLIIPLSHSTNNIYDVQVPMRHIYDTDVSFARVRLQAPVHIKTLKRYICTLPDSIMKVIDARLLMLTVPRLVDYPPKELKSLFGIDVTLEQTVLPEKINFTTELKNSIKLFMDSHLEFTNDENDKMSIYQLKDMFDEFCFANSLSSTEDMIVFIDAFNYHIPSKNYQFQEYDKYNSYELIGIKVKVNENVCIDDHKFEKKWDEAAIKEFILMYENDGPDDTANHFNIKVSTAIRYYNKWKEELTPKAEEEEENKEPENSGTTIIPVEPISEAEIVLNNINSIPKFVSKFGNYVRNWMKEERSFGMYAKSGTKKNKKTEMRFYEQVSNAVYFSMLYLLNIEINNGSAVFNEYPTEDNPKLDTWKFIYHLYTDQEFNLDSTNAAKTLSEYRNKYGNATGVNREWGIPLYNKLASYFPASKYNLNGICSKIKSMFCIP